MKTCSNCVFNNEFEDKCNEDKQYFYAEFGKDCPNFKEKDDNL